MQKRFLFSLTLLFSGCTFWANEMDFSPLPSKKVDRLPAATLNVNLWEDIDEKSRCKVGKKQSPIDIRATQKKQGKVDVIEAYQPQNFTASNRENTVVFSADELDRGHILINGEPYDLTQFQYRMPAEHAIMGVHYPMSIQLIHESASGKMAIISVMFTYGRRNVALDSLISSLPREDISDVALTEFDPSDLLPQESREFIYGGSLTVPPCDEGVLWFVKEQPLIASQPQFQLLSRYYKDNNRPIQKTGERTIFHID